MKTQLKKKPQMNYMQKDNLAHLLSIGVQLTCDIKFYTCNHSMPKQTLACVGKCKCDRKLIIDRPAITHFTELSD